MLLMFSRLMLCAALVAAPDSHAHAGMQDQLNRINRAIVERPSEQTLYIQRGMIYSNGAHYSEALADYRQAEKLGAPILVAYELGVLFYRMKDYDQATDNLSKYLRQFPASAAAYEARSRVYRDTGDHQRAIADLKKYFELQGAPHPGNYLAAADMLEEMGQTDAALATLDQGMEKLGLTPQLQRRAITLEMQRQQSDKAIARLETLRKPLQESPSWKIEMAELLLQQQRLLEADEFLRQAQEELTALRPTPARLELLQRVETLQQLTQ
ncbi:MAG: tetratricopeptide repeat protein [Halioglobus sp.]